MINTEQAISIGKGLPDLPRLGISAQAFRRGTIDQGFDFIARRIKTMACFSNGGEKINAFFTAWRGANNVEAMRNERCF